MVISRNMLRREDLEPWVLEAIRAHGGSATPTQVAEHIWRKHESELREGGDMFFKWQYDMRWAARSLRNQGLLSRSEDGSRGEWRVL